MEQVTFIIPTIGRETLINSVNSLLNQTIKNWYAIIIFDGIEPNFYISDKRIIIIKTDKKGKDYNSAGDVRNYGMSFVKTEWIAFLDDDDIIADDYLETFYRELKYNTGKQLDVIIFRMRLNDRIVPKLDTDNFYLCDIGISFIMKKKIYDNGLKFIPDGAEDFLYLDLIRNNGYVIIILPYIKYYVRQIDYDLNDNINSQIGTRIIIKNKKKIENNILIFLGYYYLLENNITLNE